MRTKLRSKFTLLIMMLGRLIAVPALALALRAPVLLAVALAALTTALLRAFG